MMASKEKAAAHRWSGCFFLFFSFLPFDRKTNLELDILY